MSGKTLIRIEVVYALRDAQTLVALEMKKGATALEAIERSGIVQRHPAIRLARGCIGIFGERVELKRILRDGDRVEIYRALARDPRESRRQRARPPRR